MTAPLKVSQEARELALDCPKSLWELCGCYGSGVSAYSGFPCGDCGGAGGQPPEWLCGMLQRALDMGERRGLERAAEVAEADKGMTRHGNMDFGPNVAFRIAGAIRSLGDGEGVG